MTTRSSSLRRGLTLGALILLGLSQTAAGCKSDTADSKTDAAPAAQSPEQANTAAQRADTVAPADAGDGPAVDVYPGMPLTAFSVPERKQLVQMAEAELCPCPNSTVSLHVCLQKVDQRCPMAERVIGIIAGGVKQKTKPNDVMEEVAKFVESTKKQHEFELKDTPYKGNPEAKIVFIEFADFECPHCRMASNTMSQLTEKYGDKIAFYYKQFPLQFHPNARVASIATLAAHRQGKFWPLHDLVFENQQALSPAKIKGFAEQVGLNMKKFEADMNDPAVIAQVERDRAEGEKAGIQGTPTVYLNGYLYMGDKSLEALSAEVDRLLAEQK